MLLELKNISHSMSSYGALLFDIRCEINILICNIAILTNNSNVLIMTATERPFRFLKINEFKSKISIITVTIE